MSDAVILTCSTCGARNRVPPSRFKDAPVCGKCKTRLALGGQAFPVTDASFDEAVLQAPLPVLVDFWATWCGPCRMVGPVLEQVAAELAGKVLVAKLDVDQNPRTAQRFFVQGVPTIALFSGGSEVDRRVGAVPRGEIQSLLSPVL